MCSQSWTEMTWMAVAETEAVEDIMIMATCSLTAG